MYKGKYTIHIQTKGVTRIYKDCFVLNYYVMENLLTYIYKGKIKQMKPIGIKEYSNNILFITDFYTLYNE